METTRKFGIGGGKSLFDNDAKVFSVSNIGGQLVPSVYIQNDNCVSK